MKNLRKWDIFYINDQNVYFGADVDVKQRPCVVIAVVGSNIIFTPLTSNSTDYNNEYRNIKLSTKFNVQTFINLSHIFTINAIKTNIYFKNQRLNFIDRHTIQKQLNKLLKVDSIQTLEKQSNEEMKNIPQTQTQTQTGNGINTQNQNQSVNIHKKGDN